MAPVYRLAEVGGKIYTDISSYFRLYQLDVSMNAEEGSVNQSTIQADDPTGVFDIVGTRRLVISDDTASSSNTRIWDGYVAGRRVHRGDSQLTGTARVWDIDLVDINSLLALRVITGTDANRPAETDVARVQWLYGSNENAHITDSLYLNTSGPIAMDAADYRGQRFNQVLDDCAQASGKNYFVWWREEVAKLSLWYDFASSTSYSSPLRLSNVATEVDSVLTFAISPDTELSRSPDRVNSGAYLPFDGGAVYVQNTATANSFVRRDANMPSENVKTTAKATARANRYLLEMNTEEDVITATVQLPAAQVNFIMQGMRVQVKASHLPGYGTLFQWLRVLNRSVQQVSEEFYDVKMELSQPYPPQVIVAAAATADHTLTCCNTVIVDSIRNCNNTAVLAAVSGSTWYYEARNTQHDPQGFTGGATLWRVFAGSSLMVDLTPVPGSQGAVPPFSSVPLQTGTFGVGVQPTDNFLMTAGADYAGSGGPPSANECWEVKLYRLS